MHGKKSINKNNSRSPLGEQKNKTEVTSQVRLIENIGEEEKKKQYSIHTKIQKSSQTAKRYVLLEIRVAKRVKWTPRGY